MCLYRPEAVRAEVQAQWAPSGMHVIHVSVVSNAFLEKNIFLLCCDTLKSDMLGLGQSMFSPTFK